MERKLSGKESLSVLMELCTGVIDMSNGLKEGTHEMKKFKDGVIIIMPKNKPALRTTTYRRR